MQRRIIKFPDHKHIETYDLLKKAKLHLEKLKDVKKNVVIVVQDYTRDCNWINHLLIREIMNVVPVERLSIVVASGLHRASSLIELGSMFGEEIVRHVRIRAHNPLCASPAIMLDDKYVVGVHCSLPHLHVDLSEVGKMIMPGLGRGVDIHNWHMEESGIAKQFMFDCNDIFDMIFDYGINDCGDVIKFFGSSSIDNGLGYRLHVNDLMKMYEVKIPEELPDVVILKPVVKNLDFILSMNAMQVCRDHHVVKKGGTICIMNPEAKEMGVHYGFMQPNGMCPAYYDKIFESEYNDRTVVFFMTNLQEHWIQEYFEREIFNFRNEQALFDFIRSRYGKGAVIHEYEGSDIMIGVK